MVRKMTGISICPPYPWMIFAHGLLYMLEYPVIRINLTIIESNKTAHVVNQGNVLREKQFK